MQGLAVTVGVKAMEATSPKALRTVAVTVGVTSGVVQEGAVQLIWLVSPTVVAVESVPVFTVQEKVRPLAWGSIACTRKEREPLPPTLAADWELSTTWGGRGVVSAAPEGDSSSPRL